MKKLSGLTILLLLAFSLQSYGQSSLVVMLGNIAPKFTNGKADANTVTRQEILSNTQLKMPPPQCEISGFTFSILPKGKEFMGPFTIKGSQLTPQIIKMLQDMEDPQGRIFIENIKLNCGGKEIPGTPILLNMVLNK